MNNDLDSLKSFLQNNFSLTSGEEEQSWEQLKDLLAQRILLWLRTDMDKLLQALYRIDVSDRDTAHAFELGEVNAVAKSLAELILNRQLQKIDYAQRFKDK